MKTMQFAVLVVLGLFPFTFALGAEEGDKLPMLPDAIGITNIVSATVIHSPKGFHSPDGRVTTYVTNGEMLGSLLERLSHFPAKRGARVQWPANADHWRVYIHGKDGKVISLNVLETGLQSPFDFTLVSSMNDPQNTELMKLLHAILQAKE